MPVRKISTRSLRGVGGAGIWFNAWNNWGTSGFVTRLTNAWFLLSWSGVLPLKASFMFAAAITSLISGLPNRDTCTAFPVGLACPGLSCRVCRAVLLHTPTTGFFDASPFSASADFGTCNTSVCTL